MHLRRGEAVRAATAMLRRRTEDFDQVGARTSRGDHCRAPSIASRQRLFHSEPHGLPGGGDRGRPEWIRLAPRGRTGTHRMTWRPTDFGSSPVRARPLSGREEARVVRHPSSALVRRSLFHVKHPIRRARRAHRISESAGSGDGALRQTNDGAETQFGARPPNPLLREFRADRPLRSRPVDKGIARDERSPHRLEKFQSPKPAHALSGPPIPAARGPLPAPCSLLPPLGTRPSGLGSRVSALGSGVWGLGSGSRICGLGRV